MPIDVEALLQPVSADKPCGVDLVDTLDPEYTQVRALIDEAAGKANEGMVDSGEEGAVAKGDWRGVRDRCVKLLARTKDVRVVACLALAQLQLEGITGLGEGLRLLREMLERYWDGVFPELDREDNNDPTRRMNAVASISPPPGARGDVMRFSQRLRETPLFGKYRPIDVAVARGEVEPVDPAAPKPDIKSIENAFTAAKLEDLQALAAAAAAAKEQFEALDQFLTQQVANSAPNLQAFKTALHDVNALLQRHLARRTGQPVGDDGGQGAGGNGDSGMHQGGRPISGDIRSSGDVVDMLEKICRYYEDNEKSSPVPLFLRAAKRMVSKTYLDIFDTLTPDAVQQLRAISSAEEKAAE